MDALALAQQIVDVVRSSALDRYRRKIALELAVKLLDDLSVTATDTPGVYADERPGGTSSRSISA